MSSFLIRILFLLFNLSNILTFDLPVTILNIPELKLSVYAYHNDNLVSQESQLVKYLQISPYNIKTTTKNNTLRKVSLYFNVEEIFNNILIPTQFTIPGYSTMVDRKELLFLYLTTFEHKYKKNKLVLIITDDNFKNEEYINEIKKICFLADLSLTEIISLSTYYKIVCENDFNNASFINLHQNIPQLNSENIKFITDYAYEQEIIQYIENLTDNKYAVYYDNRILEDVMIDGNKIIKKVNEYLYNNIRGVIRENINVLDREGKTVDIICDFEIDLDRFVLLLNEKYKFEGSCEKLFCISNYAKIFKNIFSINFSPFLKSSVLLNKVEGERIIIPEIVRYVQKNNFILENNMMKYFKKMRGYENTHRMLNMSFEEKVSLYNNIIAEEKEKKDFSLAMAMKKSILKEYEGKEYLEEVREDYEKLKGEFKTSGEIKKVVENFISNYNKVKIDKEFEKTDTTTTTTNDTTTNITNDSKEEDKEDSKKDINNNIKEDKGDINNNIKEDKEHSKKEDSKKEGKEDSNINKLLEKLKEMKDKFTSKNTDSEGQWNELFEQFQNINTDL